MIANGFAAMNDEFSGKTLKLSHLTAGTLVQETLLAEGCTSITDLYDLLMRCGESRQRTTALSKLEDFALWLEHVILNCYRG